MRRSRTMIHSAQKSDRVSYGSQEHNSTSVSETAHMRQLVISRKVDVPIVAAVLCNLDMPQVKVIDYGYQSPQTYSSDCPTKVAILS